MPGYSRSSVRVGDPYAFVAIAALNQAFKDIEAYYMKEGTEADMLEGKRTERWIRKMEGNFLLLVSATSMPIENFHQACIERINIIKKRAYARQRLP